MASFVSLPTAVRSVADIAKMPWAHVLPYYRALQDPAYPEREAWMPRSKGRTICSAEAIHIAPLLIALAAAGHPARSNEAVEWVSKLTLNGRKRDKHESSDLRNNPVLKEIARFLSDSELAQKLNYIRFKRDELKVVFQLLQEDPLIYKFPVSLEKSAQNIRPSDQFVMHDGRLKGEFIRVISENIRWAHPDPPPIQL